VSRKIGKLALFNSSGKLDWIHGVEESPDVDDAVHLLKMLGLAERLYEREISAGGRIWLYDSEDNLVSEIT